jgi:hypothetical protein
VVHLLLQYASKDCNIEARMIHKAVILIDLD